MLTPYDWQEGIGNRASYVEAKLAQGSPVLGISLPEGILIFTYRRNSRKVFEVYDLLAFSGIGQQNDLEALRTAAVDFAHQEGYNRSVEDVTVQRVVVALSQGVKRAFGDFGVSPIVARSLFSEVGETIEDDRYYVLDYDGDYRFLKGFAVVAGEEEVSRKLKDALANLKTTETSEAIESLRSIWHSAFEGDEEPPEITDLVPEAVLISRSSSKENRFTWLLGADHG